MKSIGSLEHSMFGDVAGGKVVRARGGCSLGVVAEAGDGSKAGLSSPRISEETPMCCLNPCLGG